jgi:hypothetical protein
VLARHFAELSRAHEDDFECPFHCRICGVTASNREREDRPT